MSERRVGRSMNGDPQMRRPRVCGQLHPEDGETACSLQPGHIGHHQARGADSTVMWLKPIAPLLPPPTYGPHATFIGWMVCTYNDALGVWEDDWDGVIHEDRTTAENELALAITNGEHAVLFELRRSAIRIFPDRGLIQSADDMSQEQIDAHNRAIREVLG